MTILREAAHGPIQIPVPYTTDRTAGWTIEGAQRGALKPPKISIESGALHFSLSGSSVRLTDSIHSGWLHAGNGGNLMAMFEVQDGDFDLFSDASAISAVYSDECVHVVRVSTPLCDRKTGAPLKGARAHTDLYFWATQPMVSIMTYFETDQYTPVRALALCCAAATGEALLYAGGTWQALNENAVTANGGNLICRDLRDFDAVHPFIAHIALEKCTPPRLEHEKRRWTDPCIESGDLAVQLIHRLGGLSLGSIIDRKNGALYEAAAPEPLFHLLLRSLKTDDEHMLTSESGWDSVFEERTLSGWAFRFEKGGVEVQLSAVAAPEQSRIAWEIDVWLHDQSLSVVRLDPPAARMNAGDNTHIFFALGPGQDIPVTAYTEMHDMSPYPSIGVCMAYLALYDAQKRRGLYCGFQDPLACYKMLLADCHDGVCRAEAFIPARGIDEAANGFHMDGQDVWQLFDGDWYDAALIYRSWVHACASWFTGIEAAQRNDVPEWLLKMPLWFNCNIEQSAQWMEKLFEAQADFAEMPVGVHMYNWHEIPFDTNYPHYNPAKADFVHKLPVMQARGLKVMPYINGRLWDTHDRGDYDFQFTAVAKPAAAKGRTGEVITERYESKNSKGEPVELAVMCPSTAIWQEKQMEINDWILNTLDADAVYVDQIAAAPPVTCMDRTHPHRRGGGSWWYEHYYNLIDHLNLRTAGRDKAFTTESNAEPFTGHIGGMLVWHWVGAHQVPAYPAVYAGFQPMLGRNYAAFGESDTAGFRIMAAQSLCFGDQMGWLSPECYLSNPNRGFFRDLVRLRWQYGPYFYAGRCLRPPRLEGDVGEISGSIISSPGVLSALWQRNSDGCRIAVLVNLTDRTRTIRILPDDAAPFEITLAPVSAVIQPLQ